MKLVIYCIMCVVLLISCKKTTESDTQPSLDIQINHSNTSLAAIPDEYISAARNQLHIMYGHTSHGSQITDAMVALQTWKTGYDTKYAVSSSEESGVLHLVHGSFPNGDSWASDLGNPDFTSWESATRQYLLNHPEINVVMWSWCGQVSGASEGTITTYLNLMNGLEEDYPNVVFVYMTGHLDGTGTAGNLHQRNEQIRAYCRLNKKVLFDFADIESYDPDGNEYLSRYGTDGCNYDFNNNGSTSQSGDPAEPTDGDKNWASDWQTAHPSDWFATSCAHSKPLNGNRKAYAAWHLFARIAGWNGM